MKRIIALLLVMSMMAVSVMLTACNAIGSSSSDSKDDSDSAAEPAEEETEAPEDETYVDEDDLQQWYSRVLDAIEPYADEIGELLSNILAYLDLDQMHSKITEEDENSIALDATILFANDSAELTEDGKSDLKIFIDAYVDAVFTDDNKDNIDTIIVEGHTDTNGTHEYNQQLSEKRAETVKNYCIDLHPELKDYMISKGFSYDRPILNEDGSVNMEASRRVVFSLEEKSE